MQVRERTLQQINELGTGYLPGHMGIVFTELSGVGIRAEILVRQCHMAPNGYLHAGTVVTLADTAAGYGCTANLPEGALGFTTVGRSSMDGAGRPFPIVHLRRRRST